MLNPSANARGANVLAAGFICACELDMAALKPGNVGLHGAGHGMDVADFRRSAAAAAPALTAPQGGVGRRILAAVQATRNAVGCNTNLGIVLLCAPLLQAALTRRPTEDLRRALRRVLAELSVEDARLAYEAIRLANPGGLGASPRHDVRQAPQVTLRQAMAEAAAWDAIAREYAGDYAIVFGFALPRLRQAQARWTALEAGEAWAASAVYLALLAQLPDSHIARKHGAAPAQAVSRRAAVFAEQLAACDDPRLLAPALLAWDGELKSTGMNPGTCADLTVATLFAARIEAHLEQQDLPPRGRLADGAVMRRGMSPTAP